MPRIVIIAGEASGDRLGASFIRSVRRLRPDIQIEGIAGPLMREAGCETWVDAHELAVMGFFEVFVHLPRILKIRRQVKRRLRQNPPDVLLGIDAPDFNLPVEKFARGLGIPTVHYVCPSVWAWRESRVGLIRKACNRVLCLLPFEPGFLARHGIDGRFVGHPLADDIGGEVNVGAIRRDLQLTAAEVVAILPGSRGGEVMRLGPVFARTAAILAARRPGIQFIVPAATPALRVSIERCFAEYAPGCGVRIVDGRSHDALAAADVALLTSGTVTLEAMLLKRPMVVAYRLATLSYWVATTFNLIKVKYAALPNLLADAPLVPEFIQDAATPEVLAGELLALLDSPQKCSDLAKTFAALHDQMRQSAGDRSAAEVLDVARLAQ